MIHSELSKIQAQQGSICGWKEAVFPRFSENSEISEPFQISRVSGVEQTVLVPDFWRL